MTSQIMLLAESFRFCPRCGCDAFERRNHNGFICSSCEFSFYINTGVAVAALLENERGELLLIRRARNPGAGLWAVPGGFVDAGEDAETAIIREVREETGLDIVQPRYFFSHPNPYEFRGHVVPVLDLFFAATVTGVPQNAPDEVSESGFFDPKRFDLKQIAFDSIRAALQKWNS